MKKTICGLSCLLVAVFSTSVLAQDSRDTAQANLTRDLQGKSVSLKLDMPATDKGVTISAEKANVLDRDKYQKRLKTYGTAIQNGQSSVITGVSVSKNEIVVEFAGGGSPEIDPAALAGPKPYPSSASSLESRARMNVNNNSNQSGGVVRDNENDHATLRYLSAVRKRDDSRAEAEYQTRLKKATEQAREMRQKMGSRFTIKFDTRDTATITIEDVKKLLAPYVSF